MEQRKRFMVVCLTAILLFGACGPARQAVTNQPVGESQPANRRSGDLRTKYARLLGISPQHIRDLELYSFIELWYGAPYRWGGNERTGVDCSGFTHILYREVYGQKIAKNSEQIFLQDTENTASGQLKEGDLVFFKIGGTKIDHVGVYLQNNRFVHATKRRGVVIDSLDDPYWSSVFFKGGVCRRDH